MKQASKHMFARFVDEGRLRGIVDIDDNIRMIILQGDKGAS